jgi:hypothetical protein
MGLEAYLFRVRFRKKELLKDIDAFLREYGFKAMGEFYELYTDKGVTEANLLSWPGKDKVDELSVRFSVISPATVVDQTFDFFKALKKRFDLQIQDTEIINHLFLTNTKLDDRKIGDMKVPSEKEHDEEMRKVVIPIDAEEFKKNQHNIRKRALVLSNNPRKRPIRCAETLAKMPKQDLFHLMYLEKK